MQLDDKLLEQMERKAALGHGPYDNSAYNLGSHTSSEASLEINGSVRNVHVGDADEDWLTF